MSAELLNLIHRQKSLYQKIVRSQPQDLVAIRQHRLLRSQTSTLYRQPKNAHFQTCLNNYRNSPQPLCSTINHVTGRGKQHLPPPADLVKLSDHFSILLQSNKPPTLIPVGPVLVDGLNQFPPVTVSDVEHLLLQLNSSKAGGPEGMRSWELKVAA